MKTIKKLLFTTVLMSLFFDITAFADPIVSNSNVNKKLTAKWSPIDYTITYNLDDGIVTGNPTSYNIETNNFTLNNPTKSGYIFTGWTGTGLSNTTTIVSIAKGSTGSRYYTANWSLTNYTISYSLDGGSLTDIPTYYNIETATFTLPTPTKAGCTFMGWTGSNGTTPQTSVTIKKGSTGAKSYTANWAPIPNSYDTCVKVDNISSFINSNRNTTQQICFQSDGNGKFYVKAGNFGTGNAGNPNLMSNDGILIYDGVSTTNDREKNYKCAAHLGNIMNYILYFTKGNTYGSSAQLFSDTHASVNSSEGLYYTTLSTSSLIGICSAVGAHGGYAISGYYVRVTSGYKGYYSGGYSSFAKCIDSHSASYKDAVWW